MENLIWLEDDCLRTRRNRLSLVLSQSSSSSLTTLMTLALRDLAFDSPSSTPFWNSSGTRCNSSLMADARFADVLTRRPRVCGPNTKPTTTKITAISPKPNPNNPCICTDATEWRCRATVGDKRSDWKVPGKFAVVLGTATTLWRWAKTDGEMKLATWCTMANKRIDCFNKFIMISLANTIDDREGKGSLVWCERSGFSRRECSLLLTLSTCDVCL